MCMEARNLSLGIDIGSVSVKLVLLENDRIVDSAYRRFRGNPFETLKELLDEKFSHLTSQAVHVGCTGIGGKTTQSILGGRFFGEIGALAEGSYHVVPEAKTVIEMGGNI